MPVTDYTKQGTNDTLKQANLDKYRFAHWLCDIMRNLFSSPRNINDERLRSLLFAQDGIEPDECRALIEVGMPLEKDSRKAGHTPAILVSATESSYPAEAVNLGVGSYAGLIGAFQTKSMVARKLGARIAVVTESLDGTYLITDIIESFLVLNRQLFRQDNGAVQQLNVTGSSGPQLIQAGQAGNAKELYQDVIALSAIGAVTYSIDTEGPVYRGILASVAMK